jgi:hypothetical protein
MHIDIACRRYRGEATNGAVILRHDGLRALHIRVGEVVALGALFWAQLREIIGRQQIAITDLPGTHMHARHV